MDKEILKKLINGNYKHSKNDDFSDGIGGTVKVFVVESDENRCKIWNSSNNNSFDVLYVCSEISSMLLDDEELCEGRVNDGFKEIMFEIEEK